MGSDPVIANWVFEFFLRQPLEYQTWSSLLRAMPFSSDNLNLQKLFLLKKLEYQVSQHPINHSVLTLMEELEEIEYRRGNKAVSDGLRRAYCAVAVDCTMNRVKVGLEGGDNGSKYEFFEMVKRVWRERVGRMGKTAAEAGLASELLWEWKDMIEEAVWDDKVCQSVLKKFEGVSAVEAVKDYVREEREKMGPSFLELVAETMKNDEGLRATMGVELADQVAVEDLSANRGDVDVNENIPGKEMRKQKIKLRDKLVGLRRPRGMSSRSSRGVRIVDLDDRAGEPTCGNHSSPRSEEVSKAREALRLSSLELRAAVKDPLPEALRVAEAISNEARQDKQHEPAEGNDVRPKSLLLDAAGVVQSDGGNMNNVPNPILMERNSSALTHECDESVDVSREDIACGDLLRVPSPKGIHASPSRINEMANVKVLSPKGINTSPSRTNVKVPSPKGINTSPSKTNEMTNAKVPSPKRISTSPSRINETPNVKKRRKGRRWTLLEEDTLRTGVETHGKGSWKAILTVYRDIFKDRTEVDLKDKWRNMTR